MMKKILRSLCLFAAVDFAFVGAMNALAAEPIAYLDWNPETRQLEERTVTEYTVIDENWTPTELNGWYVVKGSFAVLDPTGRKQKYTVNGVVVGDVMYGSALLKKVGSVECAAE